MNPNDSGDGSPADASPTLAPEVADTLIEGSSDQRPPLPSSPGQAGDSAPPTEVSRRDASGRIGPYELRGELARGGMGAVYRAFHPGLKRLVALKVLLAGRGAGENERARFRREAEAAARLQHPGIVAIHDVGEADGLPYLVMDLVEGQGLDKRLRDEGPLPPREAARLARDLALALGYAHTRAVLHRDMKPQNVLLDREGRPRITDFGLAKDLELDDGLTKTGVVMGTPAYMPPEQARGQAEAIDRRADVYALGATLYEMLTGRPPFRGPTMIHVIHKVLKEEPVPPRRLRREVDRDLETICLRCLEKEPERRYGTAQALAEDLGRWLDGAPIQARRPGPAERVWKWARRNPSLSSVSAGSILLLATVAGSATVLLPRRERQRLTSAAREEALRAVEAASLASARSVTPAERLGPALRALQTAQRWRDLAPGEPAARAAQVEAACALGEVALEGEQWDLATQSFEQAAALDEARGRAGRRRVEEARQARDRLREAEVLGVLARARSGELAREPEGLLDGVFALVRWPDPETVTLLGRELDEASRELLRVERELLLEATAREGDPGAWAGLPAALDERAARAGTAPLSSASEALWLRASERARTVVAGGTRREWLPLLAARQRAALGARLDAARVACEALGRLGSPGGLATSEAALGRYLEAEAEEEAAIRAARALVRLGSQSGARLAQRSRRRFGLTSRFSQELQPALVRLGVPLELEAEGGRGVYERGEARLAQGDLAGARADFERALELEPELWGAWSNLAMVRQRQGDSQAALVAFDRALALAPEEAALHYNRAGLLWTLGDQAAALQAYARAVALAPANALFRAGRAVALEATGDLDSALREMDESLRLDPAPAGRWLQRGDLHLRRGERAQALADYERALSLEPGTAPAGADRGWLRRLEGRREEAVADLQKALELDPSAAQTWDMLGNTLWDLQDAEGARVAFERALALVPGNASTHVRRGFACLLLGRLPDAIQSFDRALELQPGLPPALLGRADARRAAGDHAGALADYDGVLATNGELSGAWNNRGLALMDLARPAEALTSFERGLALEEASPVLWSNKGDALAALSRPDEARAAYDRALALEPTLVEALVGRAALRAAGDPAGARDDAAAALAIAPDDARALLLRGRASRALGDAAGALADLRHALQLAPGTDGLANEVAALERAR